MAAKKLNYRLPILTEDKLDDAQRALLQSLRAGPRGDRVKLGGPFGVYMHAPQYGELTQQLGAFLRLRPRLSRGCRSSRSCAPRGYGAPSMSGTPMRQSPRRPA